MWKPEAIRQPAAAESNRLSGEGEFSRNSGGRRSTAVTSALILAAVFTACSQEDAVSPLSTGDAQFAHGATVEQNRELAPLRAFVAKYRDLQVAKDAGWNVRVPVCRENQEEGGMGWHYLREEFVRLDPVLLEPPVLIYEPQRNGTERFVGVEYVIPYGILPRDSDPPVFLGEEFRQNDGDQLWMLHVWVGQHNPEGMFATWNPRLSCEFQVSES